MDSALLKAVEPFPTRDLKPYDRGYVSGWVVEQYQIDLVGAAERSRAEMAEALGFEDPTSFSRACRRWFKTER